MAPMRPARMIAVVPLIIYQIRSYKSQEELR